MTPHRALDEQSGLTLVELLIYLFVSALFLGLLAVLFSNGLAAQEQINARDRATGKVNVVVASLQTSVRNAVDVAVDGTGSRLDAVVITPAGVFECRAWALGADGALRYSAGAGARGGDVGDWTVLAQGARGTLSSGKAFAARGPRGVDLGIAVTIDGVTARATNGVTAKAVSDEGGAPACW